MYALQNISLSPYTNPVVRCAASVLTPVLLESGGTSSGRVRSDNVEVAFALSVVCIYSPNVYIQLSLTGGVSASPKLYI